MLLNTFKQGGGFNKILFRSAKLPALYILLGLLFASASYIDNIFPLERWQGFFDLFDKIGTIFFAIAIITFIYKFIVLTCRITEKKLVINHAVASLILSSMRKGLRLIYF